MCKSITTTVIMKERILIIEDDLNFRETLEDILRIEDYDVYSAINGRMGFEKAIEVSPNLIICDIMMPEMNGIETLNAIRKENNLAKVPFIFLTARVEKNKSEKKALAASDYMIKPFSLDELIKKVKNRLGESNID